MRYSDEVLSCCRAKLDGHDEGAVDSDDEDFGEEARRDPAQPLAMRPRRDVHAHASHVHVNRHADAMVTWLSWASHVRDGWLPPSRQEEGEFQRRGSFSLFRRGSTDDGNEGAPAGHNQARRGSSAGGMFKRRGSSARPAEGSEDDDEESKYQPRCVPCPSPTTPRVCSCAPAIRMAYSSPTREGLRLKEGLASRASTPGRARDRDARAGTPGKQRGGSKGRRGSIGSVGGSSSRGSDHGSTDGSGGEEVGRFFMTALSRSLSRARSLSLTACSSG
jgi:hypothetical protein